MIVKVETRVNIGKRRQQESNIMKGISTTKLVSANNSNKVEQYINILYVIITLSLSQNIVSCLGVSRETTRDTRREGTRFSWFWVLVPRSSIRIQVLEGILVSEVYPSTPVCYDDDLYIISGSNNYMKFTSLLLSPELPGRDLFHAQWAHLCGELFFQQLTYRFVK